MSNFLTPAQLRLLSRSELEDAFFETQEAYKDSKEELESLSSTNERLSRRLEEAKASRIQLRNDYRQLIKEMQAGNSDVPRQELPEVQSDNQTSTQDTKALKDAKAREVVNTSQFGSDKDSLQEDTSALIPSSRQLDVPSEPFIKLAFHDSRNPPSEDMSHSHMQQFSAHANLEQGSSDSDLSTQQPTTASTFPSPPAPAQSSTQPMPTPISASVPQSATMRPIQSPSSQQTREMVVPPRLEKAPKTHPKPELTNPKPKRMRFKQMTQEDFAEGVKRVEAEQRAKAEAEGTRSGPKKMLW